MVVLLQLVADMFEDYLKQLKSLEGKYVTIGIQGEKGEQKKIVRLHPANVKLPRGTKREGIDENITVAQVARDNEFGVPSKKIPKRSFLRSVFKEKRREINKIAQDVLLKDPSKFYDTLGTYLVGQIVRKINSGEFKSNSEFTIERKGSSKPLIDTGQLRNSLTYKVSSYD